MEGKNVTFDKLLHVNNVLTIGKFMYFCRDFKIIGLGYSLEDITKICLSQGIKVR